MFHFNTYIAMTEKQVKAMITAMNRVQARKEGKPFIEKKTTSVYIGDAKIDFTTEYIDREGCDTQVSISGNTICVILPSQKDEFIEKFQTLIANYRI